MLACIVTYDKRTWRRISQGRPIPEETALAWVERLNRGWPAYIHWVEKYHATQEGQEQEDNKCEYQT